MTTSGQGYLVRQASQRLSFTAALIALVYSVYEVLFFTVWRDQATDVARVTGMVEITLSLAVAIGIRLCPARHVALVGITYEAMVCGGLEVSRFSTVQNDFLASGISWSGAVILFFPMLLPASPRSTLSGALLAASMGPLGYAIAQHFGARPIEDFSVLLSYWLPTYICALVTWVPASVIQRLGEDVQRAKRLGSYELVEKLGTGGMGEVWRARHKLLARPAAVKIIRPDASGDTARLTTRFKREAQATANLESPHTVRLYDFGVTKDGVFYYVMELLKGIDLESLVKQHGPLPVSRVTHILLQVCDSLSEAHSAQMVHRDVKPANIFVVKNGQQVDFVKVLDFGLVKLTGEEHDMSRSVRASTEGKVIGTPAYLAPELTVGGEVDGRTDIYALGCVAYFLLTGQLVFSAVSPIRMAVAHATEVPEPLGHHVDVPQDFETIVMQCLEKDAKKRPQSALELARLLRQTRVAEEWTIELRERWWLDHLPELCAQSSLTSHPPLKPGALLEPAE